MQAYFAHSKQEAPGLVTFWFETERLVKYTAGQYIELGLKNSHGHNMKRWFTLSSPPGHNLVSITTRVPADGDRPYKHALLGLRPGNTVSISEPLGDFVLPKDPAIPLLWVAGGIGITPFHSMSEWLAERHEKRNITLLYAARDERSIMFQQDFANSGLKPTIIMSNPSPGWQGEIGYLSGKRILTLANPQANTLFYVAGPEKMVEEVRQQLQTSGIKAYQIITDAFLGYS